MTNIKATKDNETKTFRLNYRTAQATVLANGTVDHMSLADALDLLHRLPEDGWFCQ